MVHSLHQFIQYHYYHYYVRRHTIFHFIHIFVHVQKKKPVYKEMYTSSSLYHPVYFVVCLLLRCGVGRVDDGMLWGRRRWKYLFNIEEYQVKNKIEREWKEGGEMYVHTKCFFFRIYADYFILTYYICAVRPKVHTYMRAHTISHTHKHTTLVLAV